MRELPNRLLTVSSNVASVRLKIGRGAVTMREPSPEVSHAIDEMLQMLLKI